MTLFSKLIPVRRKSPEGSTSSPPDTAAFFGDYALSRVMTPRFLASSTVTVTSLGW